MRRSARQHRTEHWSTFLTAMAARHGVIGVEPSQQAPCTPPRDIVDGFADHLLRHTPRHTATPAWWLARAHRQGSGRCAYCGRALPPTATVCLDHLIPPSVGGPHHADAVVPCCLPCRRAKAGRDLLMWRREPIADLQALRRRLAEEACNHVGPTDEVRLRWRHPRFVCRALAVDGGTLIGWRHFKDAPIGAYLCLSTDHGAQACRASRFDGTGPVVYWAADASDDHRVLRDLIEQNAWVRPVVPAHHAANAITLPAWLTTSQGGHAGHKTMKRGIDSHDEQTSMNA